ncbi:MAG: hypothetical protein KAJ24_03145 [Candidatus Aenigmarchaeota archaeon]|nr:hypothetical protein [Candidatus Aenigmarchaeota archaeon]
MKHKIYCGQSKGKCIKSKEEPTVCASCTIEENNKWYRQGMIRGAIICVVGYFVGYFLMQIRFTL